MSAISADHQPLSLEKKQVELDLAPFGIAGLETLLPVCVRALIEPGHLTWPELLARLTVGPAAVLGLPHGSLAIGSSADVTLIDPEREWVVDASRFRSRSRNTPFHRQSFRGASS